ncbi:tetratricopeptide repeat protein [Pseudomonas sp. UMAB-08]|uniref:O-linked N-acetylglucosamine transferase, SPINDLY family protein n=1 Tax=Pseudomonas sp. UMAB-08 TaxID=1365375 RepID=UPI001C578533|nr:tetratricopeptide repeat protein [Pseudomonas sp. UMAB-08]
MASLFEQGRWDEAVVAVRSVLERLPGDANALGNLAVILRHQGKLQEAAAVYQQAIDLHPNSADVYSNFCVCLLALNNPGQALSMAEQALLIAPAHLGALVNRGNALKALDRLDEAISTYRQALGINPVLFPALINLGAVLNQQNLPCQAQIHAEQALAINPDDPDALMILGTARQKQGYVEDAISAFRRVIVLRPDDVKTHSTLLFLLMHDEMQSPAEILAAHIGFADCFEKPLRTHWQAHGNNGDPQRRLRVGFVSGDLRNHAVAHFVEPVWARLDPAVLELWVYANSPLEDAITLRLRQLVPHWRKVAALSDDELAAQIRADGIDILIDLSGHTEFNRLLTFARKPAPVQATWIGYPGTTGMSAIDYLICDPFNAPHGLYERYYTERFARLPSTGAFAPAPSAPPVNALPALHNGHITFASFNRISKLGDAVFAAWSRVLCGVPGSHLLLGHVDTDALGQYLIARFAQHGIAPERVRVLPRVSLNEYLALHQQVDIILDTWPYTGGTTTNHALWMGVPVVTLRGPSRAHCQSAAVLGRTGLGDWVADDVESFVRLAVQHATDLDALARLRAGMRARWQASPWRQATTVARGLEVGLRMMWQRWCAELSAEHFEVPVEAVWSRDERV